MHIINPHPLFSTAFHSIIILSFTFLSYHRTKLGRSLEDVWIMKGGQAGIKRNRGYKEG